MAKKRKKEYTAVLPLARDQKVIQQFKFLLVSILKPQKRPDWGRIIGDDGDLLSTRRSSKSKYLPNLRFSKFHPELAEFCVRYWSLEGDRVVGPFAGRATRASLPLR